MQFAAPPTGNLRQQVPVPIESSGLYSGKTIFNATAPTFQCIQTLPTREENLLAQINAGLVGNPAVMLGLIRFISAQEQSEDCLRLDVTVPSRPSSSNLPVVVMVQGGGNSSKRCRK
jgi:carboxylesterase type B